jgi:hypothetical protein
VANGRRHGRGDVLDFAFAHPLADVNRPVVVGELEAKVFAWSLICGLGTRAVT